MSSSVTGGMLNMRHWYPAFSTAVANAFSRMSLNGYVSTPWKPQYAKFLKPRCRNHSAAIVPSRTMSLSTRMSAGASTSAEMSTIGRFAPSSMSSSAWVPLAHRLMMMPSNCPVRESRAISVKGICCRTMPRRFWINRAMPERIRCVKEVEASASVMNATLLRFPSWPECSSFFIAADSLPCSPPWRKVVLSDF